MANNQPLCKQLVFRGMAASFADQYRPRFGHSEGTMHQLPFVALITLAPVFAAQQASLQPPASSPPSTPSPTTSQEVAATLKVTDQQLAELVRKVNALLDKQLKEDDVDAIRKLEKEMREELKDILEFKKKMLELLLKEPDPTTAAIKGVENQLVSTNAAINELNRSILSCCNHTPTVIVRPIPLWPIAICVVLTIGPVVPLFLLWWQVRKIANRNKAEDKK
ncbi:MAG: hypothetical protein QM783_05555 [Phycisphaerales bacterium]